MTKLRRHTSCERPVDAGAGWQIIAEAMSGQQANDAASTGVPDVTLLDHRMLHLTGPEALPRLWQRCPLAGSVTLSCDGAASAGAAAVTIAFLDKSAPIEEVLSLGGSSAGASGDPGS